MINRIKKFRLVQAAADLAAWRQAWQPPALLRDRTIKAALVASLLAVLYWGVIASDRYVSEAHILILSTDSSGSQSQGGNSGSSAVVEQYLLRDHLLSVDMMNKLDARLKLREHYSDWHRDPLARMWFKNSPLESFHRHYLSRVSVEIDPNAFVLVVKAQAYDAETAHAIAAMLLEEGERYMNALGHRMAGEQVVFLEQQVAQMNERVLQSRLAVMSFQNRKGLVSPQGTAENISLIVSKLEGQLTDLQTRLSAMQGYLMPNSSNLVDLNLQLAAVEKQLAREKARLAASNGQSLNKTVEEYQRLQMYAEFDLTVYKTALAALEQGRINATRKLMQMAVLQSPTRPQYPLEPQRIYNIVVFMLAIALFAGVIHLLAAIVRDHKD